MGIGVIEFKLINKILVIDDNIIFCNALKYHFSKKQFEVETCISYTEFNDKINIGEFDLILLDMRLRDGEGLDILKIIVNSSMNKMVIMVSSFLNNENILKAKELGAYKCINKNSNLFNELDTIIDDL